MSVGLQTLVLNQNYMPLSLFPLSTIPAEEAIQRVVKDNCDVVFSYDRPILTPSRTDMLWPSVIANRNAKGYFDKVRLTRESLYYRDHCVCAYCDRELSPYAGRDNSITFDHYNPRSRGGGTTWDNIVASCYDCNTKKGNHPPIGRWTPKRKPWTPNFFQLLEIRKNYPITVYDENWLQFLPNWAGEVKIGKKDKSRFMCEPVNDDNSEKTKIKKAG